MREKNQEIIRGMARVVVSAQTVSQESPAIFSVTMAVESAPGLPGLFLLLLFSSLVLLAVVPVRADGPKLAAGGAAVCAETRCWGSGRSCDAARATATFTQCALHHRTRSAIPHQMVLEYPGFTDGEALGE